MAEYIERDAVHDLVRSLTKYALASPGNTRHRITVDADDVNFGVDKIPSADVALVRHAKWEVVVGSDGKERIVCTGCRKQQDLTGVFSYCPNCGAKMDGERKGEANES